MIPSGLMVKDDYFKLLNTEIFKKIETYNDAFLKQNKQNLETYNKTWTFDSFHQWSRQWEYPYFFERIQQFIESRPGEEIKILDAGSGITYFSYFLKEQFPNVQITCIDYDPILPEAYKLVNKTMKSDITFKPMDLREISLGDDSFDLIYCVSVLEHTDNFEKILAHFNRVLKPGGALVLSFDISVNNDFDIPVERAKYLMSEIGRYFKPAASEHFKLKDLDSINSDEVLTTKHFIKYDKSLLPWRKPYKNFLRLLLKLKRPRFIYNLACYCGTYTKK